MRVASPAPRMTTKSVWSARAMKLWQSGVLPDGPRPRSTALHGDKMAGKSATTEHQLRALAEISCYTRRFVI